MSRDLEHLLNATAAEPRRPLDPAQIARIARRRRRRRHASTVIGGVVAAATALVTAVVVPLSGGADDVASPPAAEPDGVPPPAAAQPDPEPDTPSFDCPVTKPPTPGFQPPDGYPDEPSADDSVWFGTAELWTVLPVDGDYGRRKSVWWSTLFPGGVTEPQPEIDVTWERLDRSESSRQTFTTNAGNRTNANTAEDGWFMIAGIDPADPGCWQVTADYKGAGLSYVYEVTAPVGDDASAPVEPEE